MSPKPVPGTSKTAVIRSPHRPSDPSLERTIWTYPLLCFNTFQPLLLPAGATVLSVANVSGELRIYVEANPHEADMEHYELIALGTGHTAEIGDFTFIGTVLFPIARALTEVYHVYYRRTDD